MHSRNMKRSGDFHHVGRRRALDVTVAVLTLKRACGREIRPNAASKVSHGRYSSILVVESTKHVLHIQSPGPVRHVISPCP